ncbi:MAG TPA: phage tail assembly protein [Kouleothrix sp.]|uniref:phage tail assembly protein n=1 Tax=Kouleothrix sp. TaxID=2779161 RepID=UPI002CC0165C|nr:phage tail assembly protein [Kouleothrix sp.]HRC75024.1 phage tail assembly protein [Kouleothrix sp.]
MIETALQTEFEFMLPRGYVDRDGTMHRSGIMRLATAMDEIAPMRDPRVRGNQAYLVVILLSRVIKKLGDLRDINTGVIEALFSADLAYLQDFYRRINETGTSTVEVVCPECEHHFEMDVSPVGG